MIFRLYLNTSHLNIALSKDREPGTGAYYTLLAERNPEVEVNFQKGFCYFNPLFKRAPNQLYIVNGEEALVNIDNGKPLPRVTRAETDIVKRGWFEIPPAKITPDDISAGVRSLITRTPKLTGVIAQVARSTMGLRIPAQLDCPSTEAWIAWLTAQYLPLSPRARAAFITLANKNAHLETTPAILEEFETGRAPEQKFTVRIRWAQIKETQAVQRELRESGEWELTVPQSVLEGGHEAIMILAAAQFGTDWSSLPTEPIALDTINKADLPDSVKEGALIWYKPENARGFAPLFYKEQQLPNERPKTVNDYFQQILTENNGTR